MKTSKQVEQELEEEKARYEFLKNRQIELEKELKEVEKELDPYEPKARYGWGKIKVIENELEKIKLIEETEKLPIPVFNSGTRDDYRVFKVTSKRIYLKYIYRKSLEISEEFINKDGSGYNFKDINISETLKVWGNYLAKKDVI